MVNLTDDVPTATMAFLFISNFEEAKACIEGKRRSVIVKREGRQFWLVGKENVTLRTEAVETSQIERRS